MERIGVIGGGAWGTALAQVAASDGEETMIWAREPEVVESINTAHENSVFLRGIPLNPAIRATGWLGDLSECGALLVVAPAQHMRSVLAGLPRTSAPLILCAKGMEEATTKLKAAVTAGNAQAVLAALREVDEAVQGGADDSANVGNFLRIQAHVANLKATELKYWESRHGTMTPREVLLMMRQVAAIILEEVKDAQALGRIETRIAGLLGAGVREAASA